MSKWPFVSGCVRSSSSLFVVLCLLFPLEIPLLSFSRRFYDFSYGFCCRVCKYDGFYDRYRPVHALSCNMGNQGKMA